jgi:hypothetical protein
MSALPWRSPGTQRGAQVRPGDLVRTGENFHPHYHVIALTDDRAWIRDAQHGTDHVVPIDRCAKI